MRDGVHLFTSVYVPKDRSRTYPMLMERTPYGIAPYGVDTYPEHHLRWLVPYLREGYILVGQDVRGCFMSEGTFVDIRPHAANERGIDESTDTFDTIDWMVKNVPANSGKVGLWGISYPGFYAAQGAVNAHPALKAVSRKRRSPSGSWETTCITTAHSSPQGTSISSACSARSEPNPSNPTKNNGSPSIAMAKTPTTFPRYRIACQRQCASFRRQDAFLERDHAARNARCVLAGARSAAHYKNAKPAIMTVGGWFDAEDLFGALATIAPSSNRVRAPTTR